MANKLLTPSPHLTFMTCMTCMTSRSCMTGGVPMTYFTFMSRIGSHKRKKRKKKEKKKVHSGNRLVYRGEQHRLGRGTQNILVPYISIYPLCVRLLYPPWHIFSIISKFYAKKDQENIHKLDCYENFLFTYY